MKVLEETWIANDLDDLVAREGGACISGYVLRAMADATPGSIALAACAPELARMLLACEWTGGSCRSCDHEAPREARGYGDGTHRDDCAWLALMRKAGLR